jgi:hypothetical protein
MAPEEGHAHQRKNSHRISGDIARLAVPDDRRVVEVDGAKFAVGQLNLRRVLPLET